MFERTTAKLEEARTISEALSAANDAPGYRSQFNAFLSAGRAITHALQKEGAHVEGFAKWYEAKQIEMRDDELLAYVHRRRRENFHEAEPTLAFPGTHIESFSTSDAGPPPTDDAKMIGLPEGWFWLVAEGTAQERRIPITKGGRWYTAVEVIDAPRTHRGNQLKRWDARTICVLALRYYEELVHEARTEFSVVA